MSVASLACAMGLLVAACAGRADETEAGRPDISGAAGDGTPTTEVGERLLTTETTAAEAATSTSTSPTRTRPRPGNGALATRAGTCQQPGVPRQVEQGHTVVVGGTTREFLLTTPARTTGDERLPLVVDFHGLAEGHVAHARMSGFSAVALEEGFAVAFPNGTGEPVRWNANPAASDNPDLAFFDALVDKLVDEACIDRSRIYAAGLSNGAMFASLLACRRSSVVAAVTAVAGVTHPPGCEPTSPVPMLVFHGTEDPILLFQGGVDLSRIPGIGREAPPRPHDSTVDLDGPGIPAAVAAFAGDNGCSDRVAERQISDEVLVRSWECPPGGDVVFYVVLGGGHAWPGSEFSRRIEAIVGHTTFDVDATRVAWEFMSRFHR